MDNTTHIADLQRINANLHGQIATQNKSIGQLQEELRDAKYRVKRAEEMNAASKLEVKHIVRKFEETLREYEHKSKSLRQENFEMRERHIAEQKALGRKMIAEKDELSERLEAKIAATVQQMRQFNSEKDLHISSLAKDKVVMENHLQQYRDE